MKLTLTPKTKRKAGMTLLELTVVILVLLSLIAILFVGARAWKKGSDRSANIMNIRNVQQAVRGHQNMRGLTEGTLIDSTVIVGRPAAEEVKDGDGNVTTPAVAGIEGYLKAPTPPTSGITYAYGPSIPPVGTLYLVATYAPSAPASDYAPAASVTADW